MERVGYLVVWFSIADFVCCFRLTQGASCGVFWIPGLLLLD